MIFPVSACQSGQNLANSAEFGLALP